MRKMGRPLRFCHLTTFYPPYSFGGDALYLYRLVNALASRGHEIDVVHCADSYHLLHPGKPSVRFPNHPNVKVHTLRSPWGIISPLVAQQTGRCWPKANRIMEVLLSKKFDVIHYHNISLLGPEVLRLAPDYKDFLKLYTAHEHWLVCPMHVLWKNNERVCEKPACFRCTLKFRRPPQWWRYSGMLDKCLRSVDLFLSPSRFTQQMHHERGFVYPIEHLPYFVPPSEDEQSPSSTSPHPRPYFLFVGRLEKIKGLQNLLPVFGDYQKADLLVAGTGEYEPELRRQALGMRNVFFMGPMRQAELRNLYRHAIAVIVPSICYEVFGIIILEAFREQTPVIVNRLGGLHEVVAESEGGIAYGSTRELISAMELLRSDANARKRMGLFGYMKYIERWSEDAHLDAYLAVLSQAARRKFGWVPWENLQRETLEWRAHGAEHSL